MITEIRIRMDVPRFPAPPFLAQAARSVSLDYCNNEPEEASRQQQQRQQQRILRRPRSASWLVARKQSRRNRRPNHVQPLAGMQPKILGAACAGPNYRMSTELKLTLAEGRKEQPGQDDRDRERGILGRIRETRSVEPRSVREDQHQYQHQHQQSRRSGRRRIDDFDVVGHTREQQAVQTKLPQPQPSTPTITTSTETSERLSPVRPDERLRNRAMTLHHRPSYKSASVQTRDAVLYRLRVFPTLKDIVNEEAKPPDPGLLSRLLRFSRFLGRLALCQFGLAWLLILWAILGAGAFYVTEGPRERMQVVELKTMQRDLAVGLATELRQIRADDKEVQAVWSKKVQQYVARHEKLLLNAVNAGYGESGDNGQLWDLQGCTLFSIAVLTTLGFGAPVPRTSAGRAVAVVFAAIGIPAHFLLVLNLGLLFAIKLKRYAILKRYPECRDHESIDSMPMPMWVKVLPFVAFGFYYAMGIIGFGLGRSQPFPDAVLFPMDFTVAGGLSTIPGHTRVLYGLFLEGAVVFTAFAVAVLKVSATQSLTNVGLKYGLLVPA